MFNVINNTNKKYVAMFSGGASSAYVAYKMVQQYGKENCILFFTDTLWEDDDNYRFMEEISNYIGIDITYKINGRSPEDIFFKMGYLGNARLAKCSEELKVRETVLFIEELRVQGYEPILFFGIGPHEKQRAENLRDFYKHVPLEPVETRFPMIEIFKGDFNAKKIIENEWKIKLPRMYALGFSHANCGGRCVRGGFKHYALLYKVWPERYKQQEEMEEKFRNEFNKNVSILKKDKGPYTLKQLRQQFENDVEYLERLLNDRTIDNEDTQGVPCVCTFS